MSDFQAASTLLDKIWAQHVIADLDDGRTLLHVDRHMVHDATSEQAFDILRSRGRGIRNPNLTFAVQDHAVSTLVGRTEETDPTTRHFLTGLRQNARAHRLRLFDLRDPRQGIVHVIAPELGIALPGSLVVCGDSHTCTLGGMGALAWGIGSTQVAHVLATQTIISRRRKTMRVTFEGSLREGVTAKDMALYLIARMGSSGGRGYDVEYAGPAVTHLGLDGRFTLCNMSVEYGAGCGIVAPDDEVFEFLEGRPYAPRGRQWDQAVAHWKRLATDADATFDREITVAAGDIAPQVTWGTNPQHAVAIDERVPEVADAPDRSEQTTMDQALSYMGLRPGMSLEGLPIQRVFIGSCTNGRLSDLEQAARVVAGRTVANGVRALVVPGSSETKRAAEATGLADVFRAAGFEWRESGCSMCVALGSHDRLDPEERCVSTSNRNFEGRQGARGRVHLASPAMAAAAAVAGCITDVRKL